MGAWYTPIWRETTTMGDHTIHIFEKNEQAAPAIAWGWKWPIFEKCVPGI